MGPTLPASTNKGTALLRLLHQSDPNRLVLDDYVSWFFDEGVPLGLPQFRMNAAAQTEEEAFSQIAYRFSILREKFIDDVITKSVESGCRQLLLLGSGYDTRFLRLPVIQACGVMTFEVDLPQTVAEKQSVLERRLGRIPAGLSLVPLDLRSNDWDALSADGFVSGVDTVFVCQGLSYYLSEVTFSAALSFIAARMTDASALVFDSCWPEMVTGGGEVPGSKYNKERLKQIGEPYRFGMEPAKMEPWLRSKGIQGSRVFSVSDIELKYTGDAVLPKRSWYIVTAALGCAGSS
jgi:methyltransferase (TIGR00027 family)